MAEGEKNWTELHSRLMAFDQAESALEFALRRAAKSLGLSPKCDPKDALPKNQIEVASPPTTWTTLAEWQEHAKKYEGWWEALPLSEKYVITEPPYLNDEQRDALRAYKWAERAYWRALAWLAREPVTEVSANLDPTMRSALDRLRGWKATCVDYGPPDAMDFKDEDSPLPQSPDSEAYGWSEDGEASPALLRAWQLGGVVVSRPLPEHVVLALKRCRETYLLGCADATVALCRCVVEAATHDWLVDDGAVPAARPGSKYFVKWWKEQALLKNRRPDLKNILDNYVAAVVTAANDILHPESAKGFTDDAALSALRITFQFLERLLG